jgi:single-strand DNA-binding protein
VAVSITGKLNKAATEFAAGDSIGFGLRIGQQYLDRKTKAKEWTNYSCAVFAKAGPQADFYRSALIEGSVVAISGKEQRIEQYEGQSGVSLSIEIMNASLDNVFTMGEAPKQTAQQPKPQQQATRGATTPQVQTFGMFEADPWLDYAPTATTNGATIEQVKKKYNGDLNAAKANRHVALNIEDDIPF